MTNRRVLHKLLLVAMDLPTFDIECDNWLIVHNLITAVEVENSKGRMFFLTITGKNLLNNTVQHFSLALQSFHDSGQLNVKDTNGTTEENNDNTNEQKRDGGKGKATKSCKKRGHDSQL